MEGRKEDDYYEDESEESAEEASSLKLETLTPKELLEEIVKGGEQTIMEWHKSILRNPPKFDAFLEAANTIKNRYPSVILYDRTRVKLKGKDDYYHASYVDSYEKADGYVLTQSPFDRHTEVDFWRLFQQVQPILVVVLTAFEDSAGKRLMRNFWPSLKQKKELNEAGISVVCTSFEQDSGNDIYQLEATGPGKATSIAPLIHYKKWIDDKNIPDNLLDFRAFVKLFEARATKEGREGPVCLVCATGVHRSGTYAVLDIILDRMTDQKKVGLLETVNIVRSQRYGCMSHLNHYCHIASLILRHAVSTGLVNKKKIGSFNI